ncbi:MAG: hypothetical protein H7A39_00305 [Chlamydiales bacterium]|nr:hypothetical protein [Chlamydiales bacterium]
MIPSLVGRTDSDDGSLVKRDSSSGSWRTPRRSIGPNDQHLTTDDPQLLGLSPELFSVFSKERKFDSTNDSKMTALDAELPPTSELKKTQKICCILQ